MIICPVMMLAVRRTDKVRGRTLILIVSINTRKGVSRKGVPVGTK